MVALSFGTAARLSCQAWGRLLPGSPEGLAQCVQCQSVGGGEGGRQEKGQAGAVLRPAASEGWRRPESRASAGQKAMSSVSSSAALPSLYQGGLHRTCDPP